MPPAPVSLPISAEDLELLERVARRVVELRLEVPAILTLETGRPLSLLASQGLLFFEPLIATIFPSDTRRFARLIERRDAIEHLTRRIEALADEALRARRAAAAERRHARGKRAT